MSTLNCGVIGTGYLGKFHAEKYARMENCNLLAVADIEETVCSEIATKHSTAFVTDYRKLLGKLDAVSIVTPTATHYQIARDFLKSGAHVLIEKPMAISLAQADELIEIANQNQRLLQIGHIERFNPALLSLGALISEPLFVESTRLMPLNNRDQDTCVILDLMIHDLDIISHLVSSEIIDIRANGIEILSNGIDIANARIEFSNACTANITASRISRKTERKLRLFKKNQYFSIDLHNNCYTACYLREQQRIEYDEKEFPKTDALYAEIKHFLECIRTEQAPLVGGQEGRRALSIAIRVADTLKV